MRLGALLAVDTLTYMCTLPGESGQCSSRSVTTPYPNSPLTTSRSTRCGCSRTHQPRKHPPSAACRQLSVIRLSSAANFTHQARHHTSPKCRACYAFNNAYLLPFQVRRSSADARTNCGTPQHTRHTQSCNSAPSHLLHHTIPSSPHLAFVEHGLRWAVTMSMRPCSG